MYSVRLIALRRCRAFRQDGQPCRAWACWSDPGQRCQAHNGRHHRGPEGPDFVRKVSKRPTCTCSAYRWPHRPTSGLCEWPDPPRRRSPILAGTHAEVRYRALRRADRRNRALLENMTREALALRASSNS